MLDYLRHRANLKRVFLLIDARRGIGPVDKDVLDLLDKSAVNYQVVLTKADKTKKSELDPAMHDALAVLKKRPAAHPRVIATSSEKGLGLEDLRAEINALASPR
jgi:GTP-binding protein